MTYRYDLTSNRLLTALLFAAMSTVLALRAGAQGFFLQPNGDVGIGSSGPVARLDVHGVSQGNHGIRNVVSGGTENPNFMLTIAGAVDWRLSIDNTDGDKFKIDRGSYTAANTKLTIDSAGNVGIGISNPVEKLHVAGRIRTNSQVYSSSARFKTDVASLEDPLETVLRLRGVSFRWRDSNRHDIGFIAEEVDEVLPEVVAYDESGVRPEAVDYARMVPLLIEAIKDQQRQIEQLRAQLDGQFVEDEDR